MSWVQKYQYFSFISMFQLGGKPALGVGHLGEIQKVMDNWKGMVAGAKHCHSLAPNMILLQNNRNPRIKSVRSVI